MKTLELPTPKLAELFPIHLSAFLRLSLPLSYQCQSQERGGGRRKGGTGLGKPKWSEEKEIDPRIEGLGSSGAKALFPLTKKGWTRQKHKFPKVQVPLSHLLNSLTMSGTLKDPKNTHNWQT